MEGPASTAKAPARRWPTDREPGDRNIVRIGFDIHPQVTFWSSGFLLVFIFLSLAFTDATAGVSNAILGVINGTLGWVYILDFNIFIAAALFFALSRYGKIRLGAPTPVRSSRRCRGTRCWSPREPASASSRGPTPLLSSRRY